MPRQTARASTWARERLRKLPPIARRDARIAALVDELSKRTSESVAVPSYRRYVYAERRINGHMRHHDTAADRGNLVAPKLKGYAFAQSHGVRIPQIHAVWDSVDDISLDDLPDEVVVKSSRGAASRAVFPLRRTGGGWTLATRPELVTAEDLIHRLRDLREHGLAGGPFFAEELLAGSGEESLPVDVKVHAFYGEVAHVLLRRVSRHGEISTNTFRTILPDGSDAGPIHWKYDGSIPIPGRLTEAIDVATRLSTCIPRPFVRVDMYDVAGGLVMGEFTPRPGGNQDFGAAHDERQGHMWERAQARLLNDVIDGADYRLRFGPHSPELSVGGRPYLPPELRAD